ncbi:NUDIX domain-containing protein [Streptomyces sp. NPDC007983]|uniref:NUDIX domain-containing protein n=1 Tax=Streptomyces sp. NPDC007983 TaxID=3364800 RepID=UPI0036ECD1BA
MTTRPTPALRCTGTAALIVNSRGQYLLHLRDAHKPIPDPGTWSLPGGGPEGAETLEEAIAREIQEETGLTIDDLTPFTVVECGERDGVTRGRNQVYLGHWDGDPARLPVTEGIMFAFFDAATTAWLTMPPWAAEVIARHQADGAVTPPQSHTRHGARTVKNVIGVHLYLERDGQVLLGLRHPDAAFAPLEHHGLAGHCEQESAIACLIREAKEEAGLLIDADDVEFVHAVHLVDTSGTQPHADVLPRPAVDGRARSPGAGQVRQLGLVAGRRTAGADRCLHPGRDRRHPPRAPLHRDGLDLTDPPPPEERSIGTHTAG